MIDRRSTRRLALTASVIPVVALVTGALFIATSGAVGAATLPNTTTVAYCQPGGIPLTIHRTHIQSWWLGTHSQYHNSVADTATVTNAKGKSLKLSEQYKLYPYLVSSSGPPYATGRLVAVDALFGAVAYVNGAVQYSGDGASYSVVSGTATDLCKALQ
jgi:hypothetical protein